MATHPLKTQLEEGPFNLDEMTPGQIVYELDKYVVGQRKAKRAVAVALRNRMRRQKLSAEMAEEIQPKNILMIGSTGVGKTEIARRLARLANSPFLKVEASKFTEVGYVGRDVESIIRDLVDIAVEMIRQKRAAEVEEKAQRTAEKRLLDLLLPPLKKTKAKASQTELDKQLSSERLQKFNQTREKLRRQLREGKLNHRSVELEVPDRSFPSFEIITSQGIEEMDVNIKDFLPGIFGTRKRKHKMSVEEALDYLIVEEESKLIDMEQVTREALERVEDSGIVFIDEIDKIAGRETGQGPEISREGVQRDILPIVEGTTVSTRYGMLRTDHILFVAAGAFHVSKPSDLIPELQGRFPVRVEMDSLTEEDFVRILREPKNALVKQYRDLLATEGVRLKFTKDGIGEIAHLANLVNENTENIGARRLHTIMEALLEEISFEAPNLSRTQVIIDGKYVRDQLAEIVKNQDLSRYIL
ncbi:ATP-dependent protease ATPase subunit HslU [Acidobacteria bacterium AH-259-L09]|nr:ATP-dependent protease ATPase subunit HslU [Acidobacteria bacterium AH-259-L09]